MGEPKKDMKWKLPRDLFKDYKIYFIILLNTRKENSLYIMYVSLCALVPVHYILENI